MSKLQPKLFTTMKDYSKEQFFNDLNAGIIVAIIALPLSIALAIASGVSPERGLYTAIIGGFLISFLGGSRVQIGGPTGAFMIIVYGIVMEFGLEGLTIATIMAGILMILMGLMKLGVIIKYIPYPITTGFTSGIALTIFSSQINDFLGLNIENLPSEFIEKWSTYIGKLGNVDITTTLIGIFSILIIVFWPKINKKIPGALIALIATSLIVRFFGLEVSTIGSKFGDISSSLPSPSIPSFSLESIRLLIGPAITIAVLGSIESLLSAVVSDGMIGGKHRSNMELVGQGIANIGSAIFGGIPATGAIARTVANIKNGGRTPVAGMVHSVVLLLILLLLMPLAKVIPLASLAGVLIVVSYNMSEWREFKEMFKSPKSDVLVLLTTFFITVFIDLVKAIQIGMILAVFLFMKRMSDVTEVNIDSFDGSEEGQGSEEYEYIIKSENIKLYEINGPFFFGAADKFLGALNTVGYETDILIVRMRNVPSMDATAIDAFRRMINICEKHKTEIFITEIREQPLGALKKSGIYDRIGEENFFDTIEEAIDTSKKKIG